MADASNETEVLFGSLTARAYITKRHPDVLDDAAAVEAFEKLPAGTIEVSDENEFAYEGIAERTSLMDERVQEYLQEYPSGVVVDLGCGLDTFFQRNDNGAVRFFELDVPEVIELRERYLPSGQRDIALACSLFETSWMETVSEQTDEEVLVLASDVLHYLDLHKVFEFMDELADHFESARFVFDTVTSLGMRSGDESGEKVGLKKGLKRFWEAPAQSHGEEKFFVNKAEDLVSMLECCVDVIDERPCCKSRMRKVLAPKLMDIRLY